MRYVDVQIDRETKPTSERGFGLPLVLATSKDFNYKTYTDISEVLSTDFASNTEVYKLLSRMFGQNPRPAEIAVYGFLYDSVADQPSALSDTLNELIKTHNDFYYLVSTEQGEEEITALAEWTNTQDKLYGVTTSNEVLASTLKGQYENTFILVHDQPDRYVAEGLIATCAPRPIGSYTWTFKNVLGVPAAAYDTITVNEIHGNNASTYINEAGLLINSHGVVTTGEYIDVIQSTHFIKAQMAEYVFRLLAMKDKVPYTDAGIALIVAEVEKVLNQSFKQGIIADEEGVPLYTINVPKRSEVATNTVAQRILPDVKWTAVIAGAVEKVEIKGVLSL